MSRLDISNRGKLILTFCCRTLDWHSIRLKRQHPFGLYGHQKLWKGSAPRLVSGEYLSMLIAYVSGIRSTHSCPNEAWAFVGHCRGMCIHQIDTTHIMVSSCHFHIYLCALAWYWRVENQDNEMTSIYLERKYGYLLSLKWKSLIDMIVMLLSLSPLSFPSHFGLRMAPWPTAKPTG